LAVLLAEALPREALPREALPREALQMMEVLPMAVRENGFDLS
jgi:hypothetical protein